jgi:hypothetical protein
MTSSSKLDAPWGMEARKTPMRSGLINLTHLNFLTEPMTVNGREMAMIHIYSEAPKYEWVDASGEGIACVDDVARAAIVYLDYYRDTKDQRALNQARRLLNFVLYMQAEDGEYYNFVTDAKGTINKTGQTSFKSWSWWAARGQWALAEGYDVFKQVDKSYAKELKTAYQKGEKALERHLGRYGQYDQLHGVKTPAWFLDGGSDLSGLALMSLASWYQTEPNEQTKGLMEKLGEGVAAYQVGTFAEYPYGAQPSNISSTALWHAWGSHQVQALAKAGRLLQRQDWISAARFTADSFFTYLLTNDFVNELAVSTKKGGQIAYGASMITNGFYELYRATGDEQYAKYAGLSASWFFGNNIANFAMYNPETGYGYDGINGANAQMVNRNAGAESTIEALMALQPVLKDKVAAKYLQMKETARAYATTVELEEGKPVLGAPAYKRRNWTGEAAFSSERYYAVKPGEAIQVDLPVGEDGEYYLYLAHMRQAAPKQEGATDLLAVRAPSSIKPDGKLDEDEWKGAPVFLVNRPEQLLRGAATWPGAEKDSFSFRLMWDDENLYVAAQVKDPEHKQLDIGPGVWRGDALWLYIDTSGDKSRVNVKLTLAQTEKGPQVWDWKGGGFLPGAELGWIQQEGGYTYEAKLPLRSLGLEPREGKRFGLEVGRGTTGGGFMDWTGLDPDAATNLASLRFVKEAPVAQGGAQRQSQSPNDVAIQVQVGTEATFTLPEAVSPDRDYLWLDRLNGLPLKLKKGSYPVTLTAVGNNPARASEVDMLVLVPAKQWKRFQGPEGQLELIRHWDAAMTEWKE